MDRPSVLAVLQNWRRSFNIPTVIAAIRAQSIPVHLALVDCAPPNSEHSLPPDVLAKADSVFTVHRNLGPCSQFIAPLILTGFRYAYFAVDDFAAGPRYIEFLIKTAEALRGEFSFIGQEGRVAEADPNVECDDVTQPPILRLGRSRIRGADTPLQADVITTSSLCRPEDLVHFLKFRHDMVRVHGDQVSLFEDDLLSCFGVTRALGWPAYVTANPQGTDKSWRAKRLHAPHALCARPDHHELRDRFVRQAVQCGWRSGVK